MFPALFRSLLLLLLWQGEPAHGFVPNNQATRQQTTLPAHLFQEEPLSRREAWQQAAAMTTTASGLVVPRSALAESTPSVPTVKLGKSNLEVSRTIQGYWQLAGGHGKIKEKDALANMQAHYNAGITTLDTADI